MNPILPNGTGRPWLAFFGRMLVFCAVTAITQPLIAAPEPVATVAKPYTLYMGSNITVEHDGKLYPVRAVAGSAFVIEVDGKIVKVPTDYGASKFKLDPTLKLTETSVTLDGYKSERAYTLGNDPIVQFERGQARAQQEYAGNQAAVSQATAGFHVGDAGAAVAALAASRDSHAPTPSVGAQAMAADRGTIAQQSVAGSAGSDLQNSGSPLDGEGMFDAMDISFEAVARRPLKHPYVVMTALFHAPGDKPGEISKWVYARELPPIGTEATKIHFTQGGFPRGFTIQSLQLHLYQAGREVATTISPNRVELTRDDAFQYVMMEYLGNHKGATLPVGSAVGKLPPELRARAAAGSLQPVYYVRVNKDGHPAGVFSDQAGTKQAGDPELSAAVETMRFMPALDRGKPVEGMTPLKLD